MYYVAMDLYIVLSTGFTYALCDKVTGAIIYKNNVCVWYKQVSRVWLILVANLSILYFHFS